MLPRSVRHCTCPPSRLSHGAWTGRSLTFQRSYSSHVRLRLLSSGVVRHLPRARARGAFEAFKYLEKGRARAEADSPTVGGSSIAQNAVRLTKEQKAELDIIDSYRVVMREVATRSATAFSTTTHDITLGNVIGLTDLKARGKGFQLVAQKLQEAFGSRSYEDVDRDLDGIMHFKRGSHLVSPRTKQILMRLGYLNEPALPGTAAPEKDTSAALEGDTSTALEEDTSTAPEKNTSATPEIISAVPIPEAPRPVQESLTVDTPKNLINLKPEELLADNVLRRVPIRKSEAKSTRGQLSTPAKKGEKIAVMQGDRVQLATAESHPLTPFAMETSKVPKLSHDLSRVLFNPGVYHLQDPRSRVWNFDPYLGNLMPVSEFNYEALNKYVTSSEDVNLREVAQKKDKRYIGSTSSMSGVLAHFHFLLSAFRDLNLDNLSRGFDDEGHANFTKILKAPTAIFLRYKDGVYAVDADKEFDSANILMSLGRSMEKLLTSDKEEFEQFRRTENAAKDSEVKAGQPEAYHYSGLGQFLLRSQLDAYDPRLPGTGMFDLKTRAVAAVRMMVRDHEKGAGYQIKDRFGTWESYEREYFDMMRAAFLKYSLQVRMGRMDGIFVAYHNTERLFGFQYVPLSELDFALHGQSDATLGDQEFSLSIQMLNYIFNEATIQHPGQSLRFHFEAREATAASPQFMYVFAEPVTEDEILAIQNLKKDEIRAFEERIFNPGRAKSLESFEQDGDEVDPKSEGNGVEGADESTASQPMSSQSNAANVEFLDSILGLDLKAALAPNPEETASDKSEETPAEENSSTNEAPADSTPGKPLLAWRIYIRNLVNGLPVVRPEKLKKGDTWSLQYSLNPLSPSEARRHYMLCKNRRKSTLEAPQDTDEAANFYLKRLVNMSRSGAQWREHLDKLEAAREQVVLYGDGS